MRRPRSTLFVLAAFVLGAAGIGACGGGAGEGARSGPAGSLDLPLTGRPTELTKDGRSNEAAGKPGDSVPSAPGSPSLRSTPCELVPAARAAAILATALEKPVEAPQGPTCIYRAKRGGGFASLALQPGDYKQLSAQLNQRKRVALGDASGVCGTLGQRMLYAPVSDGWVLAVGAPCTQARQFATAALERLGAA